MTKPTESELVARFNLPDAHCDLCHDGPIPMSFVLIAGRFIDACCFVAIAYNQAQQRDQAWREVDAAIQTGVRA